MVQILLALDAQTVPITAERTGPGVLWAATQQARRRRHTFSHLRGMRRIASLRSLTPQDTPSKVKEAGRPFEIPAFSGDTSPPPTGELAVG